MSSTILQNDQTYFYHRLVQENAPESLKSTLLYLFHTGSAGLSVSTLLKIRSLSLNITRYTIQKHSHMTATFRLDGFPLSCMAHCFFFRMSVRI